MDGSPMNSPAASLEEVDKLLILGLGLIGGSLARALREGGFRGRLAAWGRKPPDGTARKPPVALSDGGARQSPDGAARGSGSLEKGLALGIIDEYSHDLEQAVAGAGLIVIAVPPLAAEALLGKVMQCAAVGAVITDAASVKGNMVAVYRAARKAMLKGGRGGIPPFVPGHPIAGSERSGVDASKADLFRGHRVILTPLPETDAAALPLVGVMWRAAGAEVVEMDAARHDAILAATSHLPHILAYALVDALARSEDGAEIFRFAAGGFRDFTRIASSDPLMWRDIALANPRELLRAMDGFRKRLAELRSAVKRGDGDALLEVFKTAKTARDEFAHL